jgi:hypothetical protein
LYFSFFIFLICSGSSSLNIFSSIIIYCYRVLSSLILFSIFKSVYSIIFLFRGLSPFFHFLFAATTYRTAFFIINYFFIFSTLIF